MRKISLVLLALAAACSGGEKKAAAGDADLDRDLALAQSQGQAQPQLQDTAIAPEPEPVPPPRREVLTREPVAAPRPASRPATPRPRPVAEEPAPAPTPAPAPASVKQPGTIAAGTTLALSANDRVCTRSSRPGDKLVATVTEAVEGANGAEIPAGSKVLLEVVSASEGTSPESGQITFRIRSVELPDGPVSASGEGTVSGGLARTKVNGGANSDKKKVATGAIAGAILGQIMGRSTKSTVIGAAAGAAA
ncbi:MAG TPA: hypothetical protein VGD77_03730, partial [Gemmatimonadaceae bacterium]